MRYNAELYKLSAYNIYIPLQDGALVYNSMGDSLEKLSLKEQQIYNLLASGQSNSVIMQVAANERYFSKVMEKFLTSRFVVAKNCIETELFDKAINLLRNKKQSFGVTIAPTMACNFACDYCFQGEHDVSRPMAASIQEQVINFIKTNLQDKQFFSVAWYGGEPLLAMDVIKSLSEKILAVCHQNNCDYRASIVTNGFCLTKEVAQRLIDYKISRVQITIDGDKAAHDSRRYIKGNIPTFDTIINNLSEIVDYEQLHFSIRVNIDKRNYQSVEHLLKYLHDKNLNRNNNFDVYFAPVDICTEECQGVADVILDKDSYSELEACLIQQAVNLNLYELTMPNRMFSLCGAILPSSFVILPNGDLHKCWNTVADSTQKVGNINTPQEIFTNDIYNEWINKQLIKYPKCYSCSILANCAGGCAAKDAIDNNSCISLLNNIKQRLIMYAISKQIIVQTDLVQ